MTERPNRATIRDVARLAGVSVATVSRVLNKSGYVKEETRFRIEAAIRQCNYRPNEAARSLIGSNSGLVSVIMPSRLNPFFSEIMDVVERTAEQHGYRLQFTNSMEDAGREHEAIQNAIDQKANGILLLPALTTDRESTRLLREAQAAGIPVVLVDRDVAEGQFEAVFLDNRHAAELGMQLLLEAGHRRIGFISCPEVMRPGHGRVDGYLASLELIGAKAEEDLIYQGMFTEQSGYDACAQFFALSEPPTAVFSTCSSETLGCIRYFSEHRMVAGVDCGLIAFDDIGLLHTIGYQLTVLDRPSRSMGEAAFSMLADRMGGQVLGIGQRRMMINVQLILRGSEGGAKKPAEPRAEKISAEE